MPLIPKGESLLPTAYYVNENHSHNETHSHLGVPPVNENHSHLEVARPNANESHYENDSHLHNKL